MRGTDPESKRRTLLRLLSFGAFSSAGISGGVLAQALGSVPGSMPGGKSIYRLNGRVNVNGAGATLDTVIQGNETIETGPGSQAIFVLGSDAFLVRENSRLQLHAEKLGLLSVARLVSGALLSVFGRGGGRRITTLTSTVGIRGTGVYAEADPEKTYLCVCYGVSQLDAVNAPGETMTVESNHHDAPKYILREPMKGQSIVPAPFLNHTDQELELIESLVGRVPPFFSPGDSYGPLRRRY